MNNSALRKIPFALALSLFATASFACEIVVDSTDDPTAVGSALPYAPANVGVSPLKALVDVTISNRCMVTGTSATDLDFCGELDDASQGIVRVDGVDYAVFAMKSLSVTATGKIEVLTAYPAIFLVGGAVENQGLISASAETNGGYEGHAGAADGPADFKPSAANGAGRASTGAASQGAGTGAGGGSYCGFGGGMATTNSYGSPTLIPLLPGAPGGAAYSRGGAGGGAVQISAVSIVNGAQGVIEAGGGYGSLFGGGGGSGGAILLEGVTVKNQGHLAANGGGGAASPGVDGSAPTWTDQVAAGGHSSQGNDGGAGSAAASINGADGKLTNTSVGSHPEIDGHPGGGGGGAGRIRVATKEATGFANSGTVTPSLSTACATSGLLQLK
jgi:hypothetical protein